MARKPSTKQKIDLAAFDEPGARVIKSSLTDELAASYGEYAYSVIHSRALPDARDGLKPVHRRIMFAMHEMGLRPEKGYVKAARVVGDVMGKYHPHGDSAIYDAMVRLAQDFSLNAPLIDGHGAWGTTDDSAAASRYTECRMTEMAMLLVDGLDEETVAMEMNYDDSLEVPTVMPAAFPNLLVNGTSGMAVGMACNLIPHNLGEVVEAARYLVKHPNARLDKLMEFVPGPDLPTGGLLLGMDEVRKAYETGRGVVRIRARVEIGPVEGSRGRQGITVTEFPYGVGPEQVAEKIRELIRDKKQLLGVADVRNLTDMTTEGESMIIECKVGVNAQAMLADLYKLTPLEQSFGINNNVLIMRENGTTRPETLGLKELLEVFLAHRYDVVTKRTKFRLRKKSERRHLVEGLLVALDNVDEVVRIIRASADVAQAKAELVARFSDAQVTLGGKKTRRGLDETQAAYILDMQLRRLVSLEVETLRSEWDTLTSEMEGLQRILDDDAVLRKVVADELAQVAKEHASPRRTTLMDGDLKEVLAASAPSSPLEVADDPCQVLMSATGLVMRTAAMSEETPEGGRRRSARVKHDTMSHVIDTTARGKFLVITSAGRAFRADVLSIPVLPPGGGSVTVRGGMPASELVTGLARGEKVVGISPMEPSPGIALGTRNGQVMICKTDWPVRGEEWELIGLKDGDELVGAHPLSGGNETLVFVTDEAQLLRFPAGKVRPQGRGAGGMAGINLPGGARAVFFGAVRTDDDAHGEPLVVTSTGGSVKVTPLAEYPEKGRATGGVRCHRFLRNENRVQVAWVGQRPIGAIKTGEPVDLPDVDRRRDGSGAAAFGPDLIGHLVERP